MKNDVLKDATIFFQALKLILKIRKKKFWESCFKMNIIFNIITGMIHEYIMEEKNAIARI